MNVINGLSLLFTIGSVFGICMLLWMNTNAGKKWLEEL